MFGLVDCPVYEHNRHTPLPMQSSSWKADRLVRLFTSRRMRLSQTRNVELERGLRNYHGDLTSLGYLAQAIYTKVQFLAIRWWPSSPGGPLSPSQELVLEPEKERKQSLSSATAAVMGTRTIPHPTTHNPPSYFLQHGKLQVLVSNSCIAPSPVPLVCNNSHSRPDHCSSP